MSRTVTSSFGASRRESHDATTFYSRTLHDEKPIPPMAPPALPLTHPEPSPMTPPAPVEWIDQLILGSSTDMSAIPDQGVSLAFTSPPYNVGKEYDSNMSLESYLSLIRSVAREVYRVLRPGGRYVVNIAN